MEPTREISNKPAQVELPAVKAPALKAALNPALPVAQATDTAASVSYEVLRKEIDESVKNANERLSELNQKLSISIDSGTGSIVVKVTDSQTGEILRQLPSEEALRIARNIDSLTGILVDQKG